MAKDILGSRDWIVLRNWPKTERYAFWNIWRQGPTGTLTLLDNFVCPGTRRSWVMDETGAVAFALAGYGRLIRQAPGFRLRIDWSRMVRADTGRFSDA